MERGGFDQRSKKVMDTFDYEMHPLEEGDPWEKKVKNEFSAIKEKVVEKTEGINLSYENIINDKWNLLHDFKKPKIAKYKGTSNAAIHAQ